MFSLIQTSSFLYHYHILKSVGICSSSSGSSGLSVLIDCGQVVASGEPGCYPARAHCLTLREANMTEPAFEKRSCIVRSTDEETGGKAHQSTSRIQGPGRNLQGQGNFKRGG